MFLSPLSGTSPGQKNQPSRLRLTNHGKEKDGFIYRLLANEQQRPTESLRSQAILSTSKRHRKEVMTEARFEATDHIEAESYQIELVQWAAGTDASSVATLQV